jgi:hypothetical protein
MYSGIFVFRLERKNLPKKRKMFLSLIKLTLIINCIPIVFSAEEELGLIVKLNSLTVAQSIERVGMSVMILANTTLATYKGHIRDINSSIYLPLKIAGLAAKETQESFYTLLVPGIQAIDQIIADITFLNYYKDLTTESQVKYPDCFSHISDPEHHFVEVSRTLQRMAETLDTTWTTIEISREPVKSLLIDFFIGSKTELVNLSYRVQQHLLIMDELMSNAIPPRLLSYLQENLSCYPIGKFERSTLESCTKTSTGLECNIKLETYGQLKNYEHYIPVNYAGIELDIGQPINHLTKLPQQADFYLLSCEDFTPTDNIHKCTSSDFDNPCISAIVKNEHNNAIQKCNFTLIAPALPVRLFDSGILVTDNKYVIKSFNTPTESTTIKNTSPMVIYTNKLLRFLYKQQDINFVGMAKIKQEKFVKSALNDTLLTVMRSKALLKAALSWDWVAIFKYFSTISHFIILPVSIVGCGISLSAMHLCKCANPFKKLSRKSQQEAKLRTANYIVNKHRQKRSRQ